MMSKMEIYMKYINAGYYMHKKQLYSLLNICMTSAIYLQFLMHLELPGVCY